MPQARRARALLALAILLEVSGTLCLRLSDAFTALGWAAAVVGCYVTSMFVFARALALGLPLSVGYATMTATGLTCATLASWALFAEPLSAVQAGGLLLLVAGVVALQTGGPRSEVRE